MTLLVLSLLAARSLAAQTVPDGAQRFWFEVQIGGSTQQPNCSGCGQTYRIGGPSLSAALGETITPHFGVAVLLRRFDELSFEDAHSGNYAVVLGQYLLDPGDLVGLTLNAGLGYAAQQGDAPPNGDNGHGAVLAGGLALRLPSASTFGFTLNLDLMKSVTGNVRTTTGQGSSYHPLLFTIGLGLNIASASRK